MSPSGAELLRQVKSQIEEVDPSEVNELIDEGVAVIDVRETEEFAAGHLPGAKHVSAQLPRVTHRGSRARPRDAGDPLLRLGQPLGLRGTHAERGARLRARPLDDRRNHAVEGPRLRGRGAARAHGRAARPLLAPPADPRDRHRGPAEAARRQGAAARRRRPRLADRAVPRGGRRRHARDRRRRRRRPLQPPAPGDPHHRPHRRGEGRLRRGVDPRAQPRRRTSSSTRRASTPRTSWRSSRATT